MWEEKLVKVISVWSAPQPPTPTWTLFNEGIETYMYTTSITKTLFWTILICQAFLADVHRVKWASKARAGRFWRIVLIARVSTVNIGVVSVRDCVYLSAVNHIPTPLRVTVPLPNKTQQHQSEFWFKQPFHSQLH